MEWELVDQQEAEQVALRYKLLSCGLHSLAIVIPAFRIQLLFSSFMKLNNDAYIFLVIGH